MHPLEQFKYCPKCGSPRFVEHNQKSMHCEACGFTYYINPSAATVALIEREVQTDDISHPHVEWCVVRRAKEPAKGTLDLPGGFSDLYETSEEGVIREVKEETGLDVERVEFLFSLPNQYEYSGFTVHTMDMFYRCHVNPSSCGEARAADDAAELRWICPKDLKAEDFGLLSVRRGVQRLLAAYEGTFSAEKRENTP